MQKEVKMLATKEDINECINEAIDFFKSKNTHFSHFKLCIPWSAGSGKTSAIVDFIIEYWRLGIIYSAGTIDEIEVVYEKIIKKLPTKFHNKIFRFHSKRPDWDIVKTNPKLLEDYPVILITHHTLSTMIPSYLVSRKQGYSETRPKDSVRRYCITDEKAIYSREFTIPKNQMAYLKLLFQNTDIEDRDFLENYSKLLPTGLETAEVVLREFKGSSKIKLPITSNNNIVEDHLYGKTVRLVTELLYPKIEQVGSIGNLKGTIYTEDTKLVYDISNIEINHINFDGTGDIIFSNSKNWFVSTNKFPYKFSGEFKLIDNFDPIIRRSNSKNEDEYTLAGNLDNYISNISNNIINSIQNGKKPFVVTWKDVSYKTFHNSELSESDFEITVKNIKNIENRLSDLGYYNGINYYLTYWYSGETRATNKFSDADEVWLYQYCNLPFEEVSKLKTVFENDKLTSKELFKAEIIQAIYRSRVRSGENIVVYYDKSLSNIILEVKKYLEIKVFEDNEDQNLSIFQKLKIRKNIKEDIEKIINHFGGISNVLNSSIEIKFEEIIELIPKANLKRRSYDVLVLSLKEHLNCNLSIN